MPQSDQPDDATAKAWRQVNNIIQELLYTEKAYCKSLNIMVGEWYEPLAARVGTDEQVLTQQQINVIFGNITIINNLHKDLLKDLEEQGTDPGDIGKVFREFSPYLKMYTAYLNNNAAGIQMWADVRKQRNNARFELFMSERHGEPLDSLMIKPVQRIPRYKMLLEELLKFMPGTETLKRENLQLALTSVSISATHCNNRIAEAVKIQEANELQERFQGKVPSDLSRRLLLEETMCKKNRRGNLQDRVFILFTDCLLYCKSATTLAEHKTHLFPLEARAVDTTAQPHHRAPGHFPFEVRASSKSYIVYAKDEAQQQKWINEIQNSVHQYTQARIEKLKRAATAAGLNPDAGLKVVPISRDKWEDEEFCTLCQKRFRKILRPRHHCRRCGRCVCHPCSPFTHEMANREERICNLCNQELIITNQKQAYVAPVWAVDTDKCSLCEVVFEKFRNTRHHCRNCGSCVCNNCSAYRIRLPNDAVGKDSRVCENCHSKLSGRNPTSSLSKATSAVNPNIHGDGDAGGIGSSSESEAQPESSTTVVDISSAEHEPSSSSSTTAAQPPRANWRQSVMGAMDASSIMSAARGLKKRGKKKRHPRAPQASWIREQTEAEAKRRQGFDSGADSDSDSDSEGPPPAPARRRGSDTSTMTETSQRSRPASTAQPANAESPALSSDNDSDANARPLTLKRYGSVPITGVLDAATQRALQAYLNAHWDTAAFRKGKKLHAKTFTKGELKPGTRKALLTFLGNSPHCASMTIPVSGDDSTVAKALQVFLNAEWDRAKFRKSKLENKGRLTAGTIKALQSFLCSFEKRPEAIAGAYVGDRRSSDRRSVDRGSVNRRLLNRLSLSRSDSGHLSVGSSSSAGTRSSVDTPSSAGNRSSAASSGSSATRLSTGGKPPKPPKRDAVKPRRSNGQPSSRPAGDAVTNPVAEASAAAAATRNSRDHSPPVPHRPKSVTLSRPGSRRLQAQLNRASRGSGGTSSAHSSVDFRRSTDRLPPLPAHAAANAELEDPPVLPPKPRDLPVPTDEEDNVHQIGHSGEFAGLMTSEFSGAVITAAVRDSSTDDSDDDAPPAPPRRGSVISNVSDGSQKPQGQLRQQPSPIEVASRAIHIKARKKVAVTKPVRPSLPHDQQPADHENDGSQKPHEDVNNPFLQRGKAHVHKKVERASQVPSPVVAAAAAAAANRLKPPRPKSLPPKPPTRKMVHKLQEASRKLDVGTDAVSDDDDDAGISRPPVTRTRTREEQLLEDYVAAHSPASSPRAERPVSLDAPPVPPPRRRTIASGSPSTAAPSKKAPSAPNINRRSKPKLKPPPPAP